MDTSSAFGNGVSVEQGTNEYVNSAYMEYCRRPADQRFEDIDSLHKAVKARAYASTERDVDLAHGIEAYPVDVHGVVEDGQEAGAVVDSGTRGLALRVMNEPLAATHWAFGGLCTLIGHPAGYLSEKLPADLAAQCINHGLKAKGGEAKLLSVAEEDQSPQLRATTSTRYGWRLCKRFLKKHVGSSMRLRPGSASQAGCMPRIVMCFFILLMGAPLWIATDSGKRMHSTVVSFATIARSEQGRSDSKHFYSVKLVEIIKFGVSRIIKFSKFVTMAGRTSILRIRPDRLWIRSYSRLPLA